MSSSSLCWCRGGAFSLEETPRPNVRQLTEKIQTSHLTVEDKGDRLIVIL